MSEEDGSYPEVMYKSPDFTQRESEQQIHGQTYKKVDAVKDNLLSEGILVSDEIEKIGAALAKAQGEIKSAKKETENPHLKKNYADLASVFDACRDQLTKNGIAVLQSTIPSPPGTVGLRTMLIHESGQFISGKIIIPGGGNTPQLFGSAMTYARRYSLMSLVGIAPDDDDDGHSASTTSAAAATQTGYGPRTNNYQNTTARPAQTAPQAAPKPAAAAPAAAQPKPAVNLESDPFEADSSPPAPAPRPSANAASSPAPSPFNTTRRTQAQAVKECRQALLDSGFSQPEISDLMKAPQSLSGSDDKIAALDALAVKAKNKSIHPVG